ncbi:hypothetical protein QTO34_019325 [Cnephaeus nilssonii]|uniref:Peptidase A2 domain-containing protein n=1 Tax=Cnephaeus nilssonii TaxID=3371016 RepID=A0AA40LML4_CNENI|nr:hypothetical protein QTO34_019325 [Eptesicus nilssonii]
MVEMKIGGQTVNFIVDTGAEHSVVTQKVASLSGREVIIIGATGDHTSRPFCRPRRCQLCGHQVVHEFLLPGPSNGQRPFSQNGSRNHLCPVGSAQLHLAGKPKHRNKEQFTWTRLPQGFKNSSTLFSGALAADLSKFPGQDVGCNLLQYVDDLLLASSMKKPSWTKLTEAPALGLPDATRDFNLFLHKNNGVVLGVLTQELGPWQRPVAYLSKQIDPVASGWHSCLRALAAPALLFKEATSSLWDRT